MGAGAEKRYLQMVLRQSQEEERIDHIRACLRSGRAEMQASTPPRAASKRTSKAAVRRWMVANAEEYEGATQLAEAAVCEYPELASSLDEETHWLWDIAADCYEEGV